MPITQGEALPNITTTKTTTTGGPDWYNEYLQQLSQPGTALLGKTGEELIAPMSTLQTGAIQAAPGDLSRYESLMSEAGDTARLAAQGITPEMIQSYMNPYTSSVVDEMGRLQQQNLQRNLLPSLKGAFAGTGGTGSQRMMGALGQMGADVQANLVGQQQKALEGGYNKALETALAQAGLTRAAAETQKGVASADLQSAIEALKEQYGLGEKEQAFRQSQILAPTAAAKSAADVYANIKVPTTVSETANAPIPGAYSTSPLSQIAGLGALFSSGASGTSAVQGALNTLFGNQAATYPGGIVGWLTSQFGGDGTGDVGNITTDGPTVAPDEFGTDGEAP